MKCLLCGSENADGNKFCSSCGAKLESAVETVPVEVTPIEVTPIEATPVETAPIETTPIEAKEDIIYQTESEIDDAGQQNTGDFSGEYTNDATASYTETVNNDSLGNNTADSSYSSYSENTTNYDSAYQNNMNTDGAYADYADVRQGIGFAIASLVCGILSIFSCVTCCGGVVLGIVAIVLGIITLTKCYDGRGMAIAGIVTGVVGLLIALVFLAAVVASDSGSNGNSYYDTVTEMFEEEF